MARTYTDKKGYKRFSDSGTSVHRWSASKSMGRSLRSGEVVHHKNRIKTDNRPSNLQVFSSQRKHDSVHRTNKKKTGWW